MPCFEAGAFRRHRAEKLSETTGVTAHVRDELFEKRFWECEKRMEHVIAKTALQMIWLWSLRRNHETRPTLPLHIVARALCWVLKALCIQPP